MFNSFKNNEKAFSNMLGATVILDNILVSGSEKAEHLNQVRVKNQEKCIFSRKASLILDALYIEEYTLESILKLRYFVPIFLFSVLII